MSDSVRPHGQQPTRLPRPWDSPGKKIGVGCHFLLQCMKVKNEREVAQSCPTLRDPIDCSPPGSSVHGIFQARVLEWGATAFSSPLLGCYYLRDMAPMCKHPSAELPLGAPAGPGLGWLPPSRPLHLGWRNGEWALPAAGPAAHG